MKKKLCSAFTGLLLALTLTACSTEPELVQFKTDIDTFCESVASINDSINNIDAGADNASSLALDYLDQLDKTFQDFAAMDFPEDYDYLESVAKEASQYMTEAVKNYHQAYENDSYDETAASYARENSARAFKRIQVILSVLRGDVSSNDEE